MTNNICANLPRCSLLLQFSWQEHDGNLVQHQRLKEEVQRMLRDPVENLLEKLELIDAIQRLGVSHHFEREIDDLLGGIYEYHSSKKHVEIDDQDLYLVALCFRLLRQQGYKIPSGKYLLFIYLFLGVKP